MEFLTFISNLIYPVFPISINRNYPSSRSDPRQTSRLLSLWHLSSKLSRNPVDSAFQNIVRTQPFLIPLRASTLAQDILMSSLGSCSSLLTGLLLLSLHILQQPELPFLNASDHVLSGLKPCPGPHSSGMKTKVDPISPLPNSTWNSPTPLLFSPLLQPQWPPCCSYIPGPAPAPLAAFAFPLNSCKPHLITSFGSLLKRNANHLFIMALPAPELPSLFSAYFSPIAIITV